ncbi:MAG: hypothetical protein WA160_04125 [Pseudobdellovibrio sp.]
MDLIWIMFGFFILVTIVFVVFAILFPEWIGITGKKAHEIQKHQHEDDKQP